MKLLQSSFSIIFFALFFFSCSTKNETSLEKKYLEKESLKEWKTYAEKLVDSATVDDIKFKNSLFLFVYPTSCGDCLNEIKFWEKFYSSRSDYTTNLYMVVIEQYEVRFSQFIKNNNFKMSIFRDEISEVRKKDLIPYLPAKIFFDKNEKPMILGPVNSKNLTNISNVIDKELSSN